MELPRQLAEEDEDEKVVVVVAVAVVGVVRVDGGILATAIHNVPNNRQPPGM